MRCGAPPGAAGCCWGFSVGGRRNMAQHSRSSPSQQAIATCNACPRGATPRSQHPPHHHHLQVVITDKDVVLPLIRDNIALNGLPGVPGGARHCGGCARAEELEWGRRGYLERAALLTASPFDLVVAADVTYVDQDGQSPSTEYFVETCKGTACAARGGPRTARCGRLARLSWEGQPVNCGPRPCPASNTPRPSTAALKTQPCAGRRPSASSRLSCEAPRSRTPFYARRRARSAASSGCPRRTCRAASRRITLSCTACGCDIPAAPAGLQLRCCSALQSADQGQASRFDPQLA